MAVVVLLYVHINSPSLISLMVSVDVKHHVYFTLTVGLLGTGAQDGHLDFHTAPELCMVVG